jgi:hypothetical protein
MELKNIAIDTAKTSVWVAAIAGSYIPAAISGVSYAVRVVATTVEDVSDFVIRSNFETAKNLCKMLDSFKTVSVEAELVGSSFGNDSKVVN